MSILKPKSANKSKTISVRVPMTLVTELDEIKQQADTLGLTLDIADIIERALTQAVRTARSELTDLSNSQ